MNPYTGPQSHAAMDFFQSMLKGSGMPSGFASWMVPTLDPDELERKIVDLRVVLQWLEANARLTQATIQALEVQRMTLSTLKTMNVDMSDLATHMGEAMRAGAQAMEAASGVGTPAPEAPAREAPAEPAAQPAAKEGGGAPNIAGMIDPMQWWGAISEQFGKVAAEALRESPWPMAAAAAAGDKPAAAPAKAAKSAKAAKPAAERGAAGARTGAGGARKRAPARPRSGR